MAKRRPPTGAPKAEAMPAAAPALMKFRRSSELRKREKHGSVHSKVADLNWNCVKNTIKNQIFSWLPFAQLRGIWMIFSELRNRGAHRTTFLLKVSSIIAFHERINLVLVPGHLD